VEEKLEEIKRIGRRLRNLRLKNSPQKLTLHEVAKAVGYSTATLSQIERGIIAPSIQGLLKLADFYKVSPASFFESAKEDRSVVITNPDDREKIRGDFGEVFEVMYSYPELDTVIMRAVVPPGSSSSAKLNIRDYSEFVYVCSGSINVKLQNSEYRLETGESVFIKANTPFKLLVNDDKVLEGVFIYFGKK